MFARNVVVITVYGIDPTEELIEYSIARSGSFPAVIRGPIDEITKRCEEYAVREMIENPRFFAAPDSKATVSVDIMQRIYHSLNDPKPIKTGAA